MPEGDSLAGLAQRIEPLVGSVVTRSDIRWPSLATADLSGRTLTDIRSAGKHLLMEFERWVLVTHLRMEGRWEIVEASEQGHPHGASHQVRAIITLTAPSGQTVHLIGTSLGDMHLVQKSQLHTVIGHLGPDLVNGPAAFDEQLAAANLVAEAGDSSDSSIGAALLDQRRLAGVGNVIRSEVLFLARVSPFATRAEVAEEPGLAERIVGLSRDLLRINVGRRRRTTPLGWPDDLWVYGREDRPCLVCGTPIRRAELSSLGSVQQQVERAVYWCPSCQTGPGQASERA
jgi:endonuclease-8